MSDKITMSLCEEANHLKPQRRTTYIDAEQFKYLYGDYYSKKFMKNVDDDCSFTIKYYYKEDREERKGADSVWCDMYWSIDNADMPNADQFEEECNRIKYYPYNGSSGIAMMMYGLDFVDEEDEEEEKEEEEQVEVNCICDKCFGEGKTWVSAERAKELKEMELMEECCPYGDKCNAEEEDESEDDDDEEEEDDSEDEDDGSNTCYGVETRTQKRFMMGDWNYVVVFDDDGEQKEVYMETKNGLELCEEQRLVQTFNKHGDKGIKCVYNHYELNEDRDECWITNC